MKEGRKAAIFISDDEEAAIQRGIASDPDNPEWTAQDFANARTLREINPDLAQSIERARGRPPLANPKRQISIRLDQDVIDKFRATGKGWQARINAILKDAKL